MSPERPGDQGVIKSSQRGFGVVFFFFFLFDSFLSYECDVCVEGLFRGSGTRVCLLGVKRVYVLVLLLGTRVVGP